MVGKNRIRRAYHFAVSGEIWTTNEHEIKSKPLRWIIRQMRVILYAARGVMHHDSLMRPAALTFYTIMALVPILAIVFAILKSFGAEDTINNYFAGSFPQYGSLMNDILIYSEGLLTRTRGSLVALISIFVLMWAAIRVFMSVEIAFNRIWEVKKQRGWGKRIGAYIAMVFILPLLLVIFGGVGGYIDQMLGNISVKNYVVSLISLILICGVFFLMYIVIPNKKVHWMNAMKAAAVAGLVFFIFQTGYFRLQSGVMTYNVIYGSFAAIPLFLIWAQGAWRILLYGAELSFAFQNVGCFIVERRDVLHTLHLKSKAKHLNFKVAIVGNGAVGTALSEALNGAEIITRTKLAQPPVADLYIIAVTDSAIAEVAARLPKKALKVHTAGGVNTDGVDGVLYPLQTFTKEREVELAYTPLLIEWSSERAKQTITKLANALSGIVIHANSEQRLKVHTAAVFACNFVNHLIAIGYRVVKEANLPSDILYPIIEETIDKALSVPDPAAVQTGPAVRGDQETMERHKELLNYSDKEIYEAISNSISSYKL